MPLLEASVFVKLISPVPPKQKTFRFSARKNTYVSISESPHSIGRRKMLFSEHFVPVRWHGERPGKDSAWLTVLLWTSSIGKAREACQER